jgi:hypothetical protein
VAAIASKTAGVMAMRIMGQSVTLSVPAGEAARSPRPTLPAVRRAARGEALDEGVLLGKMPGGRPPRGGPCGPPWASGRPSLYGAACGGGLPQRSLSPTWSHEADRPTRVHSVPARGDRRQTGGRWRVSHAARAQDLPRLSDCVGRPAKHAPLPRVQAHGRPRLEGLVSDDCTSGFEVVASLGRRRTSTVNEGIPRLNVVLATARRLG